MNDGESLNNDYVYLHLLNAPCGYDEAMSSNENKKWKSAMRAEYDSLAKNGTWTLVPMPPGYKSTGAKWMYLYKTDKEGEIQRYKAHYVAKGFAPLPLFLSSVMMFLTILMNMLLLSAICYEPAICITNCGHAFCGTRLSIHRRIAGGSACPGFSATQDSFAGVERSFKERDETVLWTFCDYGTCQQAKPE